MNAETLVANIRTDLLKARKDRDVVKSQALLSLVNAVDNASAVDASNYANTTEVARRVLTVNDVEQIIKNEINEIQEALAIYKAVNAEKTEELTAMVAVLKNYIESI